MDDIFSGTNEEEDLKKDSNVEWKKSGFDKNERITLKVNVKEANEHDAKKKRDASKKVKADKSLVPAGFKKLKKKIRGPLDEDEDEDEYILMPTFMEMDESSLIKVLTPEEKKLLNQRDNLENIRLQENISKQASIERAEKAVKDLGFELDKKLVAEKMNKSSKVEAKEVLEETIKKGKPVKKKQEAIKTQKLKHEKQEIKSKNAEERALEQSKRRAAKKEEIQQKKNEKTVNDELKAKEETKIQESTKTQEEEVKTVQQEELKNENLQKEEANHQETTPAPAPEPAPEVKPQDEKAKDEQVKEEIKTQEEKSIKEKSAKELIMEKRGQISATTPKAADSQEPQGLTEEEKKRYLEEQLLKKYEQNR